MATATDSIYVKILTETNQAIKGIKEWSTALAAAGAVMYKFSKDLVLEWAAAQKAQLQFTFALKQNPMLNEGSIQSLAVFAEKLANITAIDDDLVKQQLAIISTFQLSEEQMKAVMKAALDLSATGMVPLDTAVRSLAGSYEGNIGMLTRYVPQLKGLTEEQLKAGEAIRIVNERFVDTAQILASGTQGAIDSMRVALKDLAEQGGRVISRYVQPLMEILTPLIKAMSEHMNKTLSLNEALGKFNKGMASQADMIIIIKQALKEWGQEYDNLIKKTANLQKLELGQTPGSVVYENIQEYKSRLLEILALMKQWQGEYDKITKPVENIKTNIDNTTTAMESLIDATYPYVQLLQEIEDSYPHIYPVPKGKLDEIPMMGIPPIKAVQAIEMEYKKITTSSKTLGMNTKDYYKLLANIPGEMESINNSTQELADVWLKVRDQITSIGNEIAFIGATLGQAFVSGDIETGIKRIMSHMADLIVQAAIYAAAMAVPNWPMVAFWLGVAGITAFGGGVISALPSKAPTNTIIPSASKGMSPTIIVQGSVWATEDLARAVSRAMSRW